MFKPKLVLFDLDGTLVDSVPDLAYSLDETLRRLDMPTRGEAAVRNWVGNGVIRLVERGLTNSMEDKADRELMSKALPIFHEIYSENTAKRSQLYPGVKEGLEYIKQCGIKMGCVTNKGKQFTPNLLQHLGIADYFGIVISGDSLPEKKPHPLPLLHAAEKMGVTPAESLMIGDSKSDVKAARAAGFHVIAMTYGYNHGEDIRNYHPDAAIDSMIELKQLVA